MRTISHVIQESLIRRITIACENSKAVNLAQAFPDYDAPEFIKQEAVNAISAGFNQYSHTWGARVLRESLAERYNQKYGLALDPDRNVLITCGCMEALRVLIDAIARFTDGLAEIIIIEPFYESFLPQILASGGIPVFAALRGPSYDLDLGDIESKITARTRAIIINSPNNPCGRMFSKEELASLQQIASSHDLFLVSDETYEHIYYGDNHHICLLALGDEKQNLIVVSGTGKTFATTGWRIGYMLAPETILEAIRPHHDYNTVCAPTPLQYATANLLRLPESYFAELRRSYLERKTFMLTALRAAGFDCYDPMGAYYIMADFGRIGARLGITNAMTFAFEYLIKEIGVGAVPANAFYREGGAPLQVRFTFSKKMDTLREARKRLSRIATA